MSGGKTHKRTSQERIESLGIPKPRFIQWWKSSDKADWSMRIGIAVVAAITLLVACQTWRPSFAFRSGAIPTRNLIARVTFDVEDRTQTEELKLKRIREGAMVYRNRPQPLEQLRATLKNELFKVLAASSFDDMTVEQKSAFSEFYMGDETAQPGELPSDRFRMLKSVLSTDEKLDNVEFAFNMLSADKGPFHYGLLRAPQHKPEEGSQQQIQVYSTSDTPEDARYVNVESVQIALMDSRVKKALADHFRSRFDKIDDKEAVQNVAGMISDWIVKRLPQHETLVYDIPSSNIERTKLAATVEPVMQKFYAGRTELAFGGKPLGESELSLLRSEYDHWVASMSWGDRLIRVSAYAGMIAALYLLCGSYIFFVDDRRLLRDRLRLSQLLLLIVATIAFCFYAASDQYRSELAPLVVASIVTAVVYGRELALLLMAAVCISVTLFLGETLAHLVMLAAAATSSTLLVGRIRSRTHLLYVGGVSAAITVLTVVGVGIVTGETMSAAQLGDDVVNRAPTFYLVLSGLIREALWAGVFIAVAASALTPALPIVEKVFGVQTDLSLMELGDASHPLLRRLAQRAPGTYNHSINVASIAEAAADSIGANGLLVRVGAYFHDIGKMFKPEYFIENQASGINQHDTLQPAMSTLVIIAHVKDGADLARNHKLPVPIIDLIMQHHGTTLVEYFYREAARRSEEDPNGESVSDKDFRYPGPKPQTLEAAVMMLADTVESASRTLVDPTPARIQSLVDSIAQKKMADGQFDECGLTFRQLGSVRQSLVKSLTAIYHARVKYPGQQSA
ncbi:HD family phosphohydrolase [Stieleria varia]|uniref:Phosphodiesterase n=1 Tax=Stieleria varia TaxID=2528005 RepID=A0A5C6AYX4_9BACT|nr:HDIG domain-containing metalloprotein [Stieleria varia]TWU04611.1 phosphodiesterase [Stieleria varia]